MAEVDRFTASRERAAANIRNKVTRFDFEDQAKANIATTKLLGEVASTIENKTTEQNAHFDKLLKLLNYLPNDILEQRKQKKELFVYMARLTATIEDQAKRENNPLKKIQLISEAKELRKQGSYLAPGYDAGQPRGLKENFAHRVLKISPDQLRAGGGILGAYSDEIDRLTGFKKLSSMITGKKDDAFGKQVKQEKLYPELAKQLKDASFKSRYEGGIRNTDAEGMVQRKAKTSGYGSGSAREGQHTTLGGVAVLRKISDDVVLIREAIVGKSGKRTADGTFEAEPPKSLFTAAEKDYNDPKNWGIRKKGPQKGRKFWNKRNSQGRIMKPGEVEPEIPDTPPDIMAAGSDVTLSDEQKAKAAGTFDDWKKYRAAGGGRSSHEPKLNEKGELEVVIDETHKKFEGSGTEKDETPKVEGSMTSADNGSGIAILALMVEALPILGAIVLGITALGFTALAIKNLLDVDWDGKAMSKATAENQVHQNEQRKHLEELASAKNMTVEQMLKEDMAKGSVTAKFALKDYQDHKTGIMTPMDAIQPDATKSLPKIDSPKSNTGSMMEKMFTPIAPTIVAPTINNITNNNGGGGGGKTVSEPPMPSVRSTDPSFLRFQDKKQSRVF